MAVKRFHTASVDTDHFRPPLELDERFLPHLPRPLLLYVGRVTKEKGVSHLCSIAAQLPGTVLIVGDGPLRPVLSTKYPNIHFAGTKNGDELLAYYQNANVFVFPSNSETFGLVLLEALACGLPVAATPVNGPMDLISDPGVGILDPDIVKGTREALTLSSADCRRFALQYPWSEFARKTLGVLVPVGGHFSRVPKPWRPTDRYVPGGVLEKLVAATERLLFASESVERPLRRRRSFMARHPEPMILTSDDRSPP